MPSIDTSTIREFYTISYLKEIIFFFHSSFMHATQEGKTMEKVGYDASAFSVNSFTSHMSRATKERQTDALAVI